MRGAGDARAGYWAAMRRKATARNWACLVASQPDTADGSSAKSSVKCSKRPGARWSSCEAMERAWRKLPRWPGTNTTGCPAVENISSSGLAPLL